MFFFFFYLLLHYIFWFFSSCRNYWGGGKMICLPPIAIFSWGGATPRPPPLPQDRCLWRDVISRQLRYLLGCYRVYVVVTWTMSRSSSSRKSPGVVLPPRRAGQNYSEGVTVVLLHYRLMPELENDRSRPKCPHKRIFKLHSHYMSDQGAWFGTVSSFNIGLEFAMVIQLADS